MGAILLVMASRPSPAYCPAGSVSGSEREAIRLGDAVPGHLYEGFGQQEDEEMGGAIRTRSPLQTHAEGARPRRRRGPQK
jgi:hypothetical protein